VKEKTSFSFLGRPNTNGVDLNRNFPTWNQLEIDTNQLLQGREPETQALIRWILGNPFVLSINFHDGSTVVSSF
jgi:carboxypeptidase D